MHSAPVAVEVFEENAWLFARTFTQALEAGPNMAPRIAAHELRKVAKQAGIEADAAALLAEIRRLSMVIAPSASGFQPIPFDEAVRTEVLDREMSNYVENVAVFFTLSWRLLSPADRKTMTLGLVVRWGGLSTSSNSTDYARSLTTSTQAETTAAPLATPAGTVTEGGRTSSLPS